MKTKLRLLQAVFLILLVSCMQSKEKEKTPVVKSDTLQAKHYTEKEANSDSLRLDTILREALQKSQRKIGSEKFSEKYTVSSDCVKVLVELNCAHHFTKSNRHLIIRRNEPGILYIDIYAIFNHKFEKVASHKEDVLTYLSDTICDINGDGYKDFVVNTYGASGCCLKGFSSVYILQNNKKTFTPDFEFINPTFSSKEKIIRGICYGQPGETEMYKYKWNGEKIDTLEYVSYQTNEKGVKTGKIIISKNRPSSKKLQLIKIVNSVPREYRSINDFDWFVGKI